MITSARVVRGAIRAMKVIRMPVARGVARVAGTAFWALAPRRRRVIMQNLSHTAAATSPVQRIRLCRRIFANMAEAAVHLFRLPSMSREELFSLLAIEGREHLDAAHAMNRGVIVVTPHLGPYELGGAWSAAAEASQTEIVKIAERQAQDIVDDARRQARETRLEMEDRADGILSTLEVNLDKFLGAVRRGR